MSTAATGDRRVLGALTALALLLAALVLPQWMNAPHADAFGTIHNAALGQSAEHERITRAALACGAGKKSDGTCFDEDSLSELAGHFGRFGAVGEPDWNEGGVSAAHCDDADYLDAPGYPHSAADRDRNILACVDHARTRYQEGIDAAAGLVDADGVLKGAEVDLVNGCAFDAGPTGSAAHAKCDVIEGFGRSLHAVQDFYSHSNYVDRADPDKPISVTNPPGLGLHAPSPLMNLASTGPKVIPSNLTTGYYEGFLSDSCSTDNTLVEHACMNKDKADISVNTSVNPPTWTASPGSVSPYTTVRGSIPGNEKLAVDAAVVETRQQWADFRQSLIARYGADDARTMILAITQDVPKVDLVFAIDTTGSMGPYIQDVVDKADELMEDLSGGADHPYITDYRVGVVDYKDVDSPDPEYCPPDEYDATTDLPFETSHRAIVAALGTLTDKISGGCDTPEDVLSGVQRAVEFPWRNGGSKSIIVMGDASGHDPEQHSGLTEQSVIDAANAVDPASVYPILVGGDSSATAFMTGLAEGTGGKVFDSDAEGGVAQALVEAITAIAGAPPTGDTTAPDVRVDLPVAPEAQGGVFNASQTPVTGTVTATDDSGVTAITCADGSGGLTVGPLTVDPTGKATRTLTVTGDGEHLVQCQATDASPTANSGVGEGSNPVGAAIIDATAPTVGCSVSPSAIQPADGALVPVTATVTVADSASGAAGFTLASVTGGAAGDVQGFDTGTADTSGTLRAVPSAHYTLSYVGKDAAGNSATCAASVTVAAGSGGTGGTVSVDRTVNAVQQQWGVSVVSPKLTTSQGGELLLAYVSADGPAAGVQQVAKVTGGGLTWTRVARSDPRGTGTAEVWQAYATAPVKAAAVTATLGVRGWDGAVTVVAYKGAARAVGAHAQTSGAKGAAKATLTSTAAGSVMWAAGHDWSRAVHPVPLPGQKIVTQNLDQHVGDTFWVQQSAAIAAAGTAVTLGVSAPVTDRWALAAVEVVPAS